MLYGRRLSLLSSSMFCLVRPKLLGGCTVICTVCGLTNAVGTVSLQTNLGGRPRLKSEEAADSKGQRFLVDPLVDDRVAVKGGNTLGGSSFVKCGSVKGDPFPFSAAVILYTKRLFLSKVHCGVESWPNNSSLLQTALNNQTQ